MDYKSLYLQLFNKVTDFIEVLVNIQMQIEQMIIADESNEEEEDEYEYEEENEYEYEEENEYEYEEENENEKSIG